VGFPVIASPIIHERRADTDQALGQRVAGVRSP